MQKKNNILIKAIIFVVAMSVLFVVVKSSGVNEYLSPDFAKEKIDGFDKLS